MKRIVCAVMTLLVLMTLPVTAKAGEGYTYTIRVYAGNMGTINGSSVYEETGIAYGSEWSFDISQVELKNDKYYVRGIRESGQDNATVSTAAFKVKQDRDFVVAYGVRGSEVMYTVRYVRASDGAELLPAETYYGNVGDKPVVACKFIEGYHPEYYNITGTLKENGGENRFEFRYAAMPSTVREEETVTQQSGQTVVYPPEVTVNTAGETAAEGERGETTPAATQQSDQGSSPETGEKTPQEPEQAQTETIPEEPEEILDLDSPRGNHPEPEEHRKTAAGWIAAGCAAGVVAILLVLWLLLRRRKKR